MSFIKNSRKALLYQILREASKAPPNLFDNPKTFLYAVTHHLVRAHNFMANNFNEYRKSKREGSLATYSEIEMHEEIMKRQTFKNYFPLHVFPDQLKPFITALNKPYDVPRSFIGLSLLSALSTAIGTAYVVSTNRTDSIYLPVWGALVGISSSGKSLAVNKAFEPLKKIQAGFDDEWKSITQGLSDEKIKSCIMKTVIYRDSNIPVLIRNVMPDNPKGALKFSDELIEWINGMNQLSKKEGTDEQFWLSSWNCSQYSGIRSGKQKFVVERPFVGVIGGLQPSMVFKVFKNDRDTTGFVNRILFATLPEQKIASPDPTFEMPKEYTTIWDNMICRLFHELQVNDGEHTKTCLLLPDSIKVYQTWVNDMRTKINKLDEEDRETQASIFGKVKEYCLRFAAILHLAECSLRTQSDFEHRFKHEEYITTETLLKAIEVANYFYTTAVEVYEAVSIASYAPNEVVICANLMKRGKSQREIAEVFWGKAVVKNSDKYRKQMERNIKKWLKQYPKVFGSTAK